MENEKKYAVENIHTKEVRQVPAYAPELAAELFADLTKAEGGTVVNVHGEGLFQIKIEKNYYAVRIAS